MNSVRAPSGRESGSQLPARSSAAPAMRDSFYPQAQRQMICCTRGTRGCHSVRKKQPQPCGNGCVGWSTSSRELSVIRHEPDNRFLECALAADAEFIVTVNTAPGHFDRKQYQAVSVARPSEFLNVPEVGRLVKKLTRG